MKLCSETNNGLPQVICSKLVNLLKIAQFAQNVVDIGLLIAQFSSLPSLGDAPNLRAFFLMVTPARG